MSSSHLKELCYPFPLRIFCQSIQSCHSRSHVISYPKTLPERLPMTNQVFTETLIFTRCVRYTTDTCPHKKNTAMKLAEINAPKCFLLNDQTVEELNQLCSQCDHFQRDDKNSLFRVERREFPSCVPPQYVSQDVAGPQIESRPARSRPLFKCVWPISGILSTADLVPILLKCMHFGNRKPVGRMRCI